MRPPPSHCNEMPRTNPSKALERLAMTLNFPRREPISINELAGKTDLSWATTKKYVQLLEVLGRVAPRISVDEEGVTPLEIGENLNDIRNQEDIQVILYIFTHAKIKDTPATHLNFEEHSDVLSKYEEILEELEDLGWIEKTDDTIGLTPEGVSIAGQAHSRVRNKDLEPFSREKGIQSTGQEDKSHQAGILVDDPSVKDNISYKEETTSKEHWEENDYDDPNFQTIEGISG